MSNIPGVIEIDEAVPDIPFLCKIGFHKWLVTGQRFSKSHAIVDKEECYKCKKTR